MVKFFRRIRKRLLAESQFKKYLLYGIGEIVLVVIGILIALQINNWSENRKQNIEEKKLLTALIEDFNENKARIEHTISKEEDVIAMSKALIRAMQNKDTQVDHDSVQIWVASGAKSWWKTEFVMGT
ncbi:MAG: DUF6090 family protein, partial [Bacteroidota bacterium]